MDRQFPFEIPQELQKDIKELEFTMWSSLIQLKLKKLAVEMFPVVFELTANYQASTWICKGFNFNRILLSSEFTENEKMALKPFSDKYISLIDELNYGNDAFKIKKS